MHVEDNTRKWEWYQGVDKIAIEQPSFFILSQDADEISMSNKFWFACLVGYVVLLKDETKRREHLQTASPKLALR